MVIICVFNFLIGKVFDGYCNCWYQEENMDGIWVIWVWFFILVNLGFVKCILDYISFVLIGFIVSWFVKIDIIIVILLQFFIVVSGYVVVLFKCRLWIMEVWDFWLEFIWVVNVMEDSCVFDWLEKLEFFFYCKVFKVVVVMDFFKKNIVGCGIVLEKIEVVKNGVYFDKFQFCFRDKVLLVQFFQFRDQCVVGYLGIYGMVYKFDFILECVVDVL